MTLFKPRPRLLVFDVSNIAHRAAHRFKKFTTCQGTPSGHVFGAFKIITSTLNKLGGRSCECWFALDGQPRKRLALNADYKKHRVKPPFNPVTDVVNLVRLFPGLTVSHESLEADDIMAMATHERERGDREVVLVTNDQDLWQLLGYSDVGVWYKDHFVERVEVIAKFGVLDPRALALYKALFGDSSDNIKPVVPRLPKGKLVRLINERELRIPSHLQEVLEASRESYAAKLLEAWPKVRRNWELVKLRRNYNCILLRQRGASKAGPLVKFLEKFECKSLLETAKKLFEEKSRS